MTMKMKQLPILRIRHLLTLLLLGFAAFAAQASAEADTAEVERPVTSMFMVDAGHNSLLDTYVSAVTYRGVNVRLGYERMQAMKFNPRKWVMQLEAGVDYSHLHNPAGNHTEHALMVEARWGMMHRWTDVGTQGLQLQLGGMTQFRGGIIYTPINSNNVVSVKLHWCVGLSALAAYTVNRDGRVPVTLRYQATLPVAGVFYSPEYDESYYEIYLGNRKGLANFGWWGNRFDMTNLLTADLHLGATVLRFGYRCRIANSWIKQINCHDITHGFVLGVGGEWLSLSRRKAAQRHTIGAIY